MRTIKVALVVFAAFCVAVSTAEARGRRGYVSSAAVGTGHGLRVAINATLQPIAQQRADAMARAQTMSHSIHTMTAAPNWAGRGVAEGIGCSTASDPKAVATCICGSTVVADAHARGRNGMIYRVRFFR